MDGNTQEAAQAKMSWSLESAEPQMYITERNTKQSAH